MAGTIETDATGAGAPDSVTDLLQDDHRRLDAVLAEAKRSVTAGDLARAAAGFREFRGGLERHIVAEEDVLFPALDRLSGGGAGGPIAVMRHEHAEIRRLMAELAAALDGGGAAAEATRRLGDLSALLLAHNGKEEHVLYPMTDESARRASALAELVRRVRVVLAADPGGR
jgi:iron-sulfur cluster repair protein YtfE (RIC family)